MLSTPVMEFPVFNPLPDTPFPDCILGNGKPQSYRHPSVSALHAKLPLARKTPPFLRGSERHAVWPSCSADAASCTTQRLMSNSATFFTWPVVTSHCKRRWAAACSARLSITAHWQHVPLHSTVYHTSSKYTPTVFSIYAVMAEPLYIHLKFIFHFLDYLEDIKYPSKSSLFIFYAVRCLWRISSGEIVSSRLFLTVFWNCIKCIFRPT